MMRSSGAGLLPSAAVVIAVVAFAITHEGTASPPDPVAAAKSSRPALLARAQPGVPITLNLGDPEHRAFLTSQLADTPFTAAATPQLHKVLGEMRAPPPTAKTMRQMNPPPENLPVDLVDVVNAISDERGALQATGVASAVGRSTFVHAVLRIIDAETGEALGPPAVASSFTGVDAHMMATGKRVRPGQRAQAVMTVIFAPYSCPAEAVDCLPRPGQTVLGSAKPTPTPALTAHVSGAAYAQVLVQPLADTGGATAAASMANATAGGTISPAAPPQPTAPISTTDGGTTICLGRLPGSQPIQCSPDGGISCNYCDPTQGPTARPLLRLPISGTVNLRTAAASPPQITAFSSYIIPANGGSCKQYNTTSSSSGFTSLNNGMTVRWYYGQSNYDSASWAQYGQLTDNSNCWTNSGEPIHFVFQFTIQDTQGNSVPISIADFGSPNANSAVVPPTQLAYGCLAAGTPVLMADGSMKPVEKVAAGEFVRSDPSGTARRVSLTYVGSEFLPLVRITTANKKTVTVTAGHPIIGADKRVTLARRLKVGTTLLTVSGPSAVTKVEMIPPKPGEGVRVYNLDVAESRDGKSPPTDTNRTLFAGGVLVGDNFMQRQEGQRLQLAAAEGNALPVPKEWSAEFALSRRLQGGQP